LPPDIATLKLFDNSILKSADDLAALNRVSKTLDPAGVVDLLKDVGARHGAAAAKQLFVALKGLSDVQLGTLKAGNKLAIVAEAVAKVKWGDGILRKYADDVGRLGADSQAVKLFDEFASVKGSGEILRKFDIDDVGVQLELTVAKRARDSGDEVLELQRGVPGGEIDIVSRTKAIEVKMSPNNGAMRRFEAQAIRLKEHAAANGLQPEYWFKNSMHGDRLAFLEQLGIRPVLID